MFLPRDLLNETRANKKTRIWRFIPPNPRDGEEGAPTGTNYTFTQKTIYHLGIWLSMRKLGRAAEHFEDLADSAGLRIGDTRPLDAGYSSFRSEGVLQVK